jgi:hypothetical protein
MDSANVRQCSPPTWLKMFGPPLEQSGLGVQSLVVITRPPVAAS